MKRLFEIGSKITIRTDLKTGMSIKFGVNEEMEKLAGKESKILDIDGGVYRLEIDNKEFSWNISMFTEFQLILEKHKKWLNNDSEGERANLSDADLSDADLSDADLSDADLRYANLSDADLRYADLSDADLRYANLSDADLSDADLRYANLSDADLSDADLSDADLRYANLSDADLSDANLSDADLSDADLSDADLSDADLSDADLSDADLSGADLRYANLSDADLSDADLSDADLSDADLSDADLSDAENVQYPIVCPERGSFIGFKKAKSEDFDPVIVELLILEDAKRSSATTRKCRCSKTKVLSITSLDEKENYNKAMSNYAINFIYEVGKIVEVDDFDENRWNECSAGIHFFITRQEAVDY